MSLASAVYKEFVFGGHLLALGTSSMAATVSYAMGRAPTWDLLLMAYLFSFGAYAINRTSDFEQDRVSHPDRTSYLEKRRRALPVMAGGAFAVGYFLALLRSLVFFGALLIPLGLALAYSVSSSRMKKTVGISRLKEGTVVKNLVISFGWSLIPMLVGLYYSELAVAALALSPLIFLRLMVNTVFFDERDVEADMRYGVKTIPVVLGAAKASRMMDALDVVSAVYVIGLAASGVTPLFIAGLAVFAPYSILYRLYDRRGKHRDSLRDFAADGEYLLWGVVSFIGHI
jgi:4-hydroxybenzoate polyprenyltransferase